MPIHERKKTRAESAFGIHFDFHANRRQRDLGALARPDMIEALLRAVKPDFVQCDTKGHPGFSSYPTKIGVRADLDPNRDILMMWRTLTERENIALYAHHSSLWDEEILRRHPDWAVIKEDGTPDERYLSIFSPYADEIFIPQMIEIAKDYRLDGAWIDGDVWCYTHDYSPWAESAYRERFGRPLPRRGDEDFPNYLAFLRESFLDFVRHYCDEIHAAAPHFELCSAQLYGPRYFGEEFPVDFVSADRSDVNLVRNTGRLFQKQSRPWDVMSWSGSLIDRLEVDDVEHGYYCIKEPANLMQEAADVISLGGTFEFCNVTLDHPIPWAIERYAAIARFCRERAPFCFGARVVHQAGVYYSEKAFTDESDAEEAYVYPYMTDSMRDGCAALDLLLDNQYSAEYIMPEELSRGVGEYGVIVVPDIRSIEEGAKQKLLDYAANGGRLLLAGPHTLSLFSEELGIQVELCEEGRAPYIEWDGALAGMVSPYCRVSGDFTEIARYYEDSFCDEKPHTAAFEMPWGKGVVAGEVMALGALKSYPVARLRRFFGGLIRRLWSDPAVTVSGSCFVGVTLTEKDGVRLVNLINNASGAYGYANADRALSIDEIPPLINLRITAAVPARPEKVMLEPEHRPLDFTYENGKISFTIDKLDIHAVVTIK